MVTRTVASLMFGAIVKQNCSQLHHLIEGEFTGSHSSFFQKKRKITANSWAEHRLRATDRCWVTYEQIGSTFLLVLVMEQIY